MELFEWCKHYIKFKDCIKKNILNITFDKEEILVKEKQREITYLVNKNIQQSIDKLSKKQSVIITTNTKTNFDKLINNWKKLTKNKLITIMFCNPTTNQNWSVHPNTHHYISEKEKIKEGLQTLFESITRV